MQEDHFLETCVTCILICYSLWIDSTHTRSYLQFIYGNTSLYHLTHGCIDLTMQPVTWPLPCKSSSSALTGCSRISVKHQSVSGTPQRFFLWLVAWQPETVVVECRVDKERCIKLWWLIGFHQPVSTIQPSTEIHVDLIICKRNLMLTRHVSIISLIAVLIKALQKLYIEYNNCNVALDIHVCKAIHSSLDDNLD